MEWIILGVIVLLTVINVPIGYALTIATTLAILWTGAASLSVVPLNLFSGAGLRRYWRIVVTPPAAALAHSVTRFCS